MTNSAGQILLLLVGSKFGVRSLSPFIPLEQIDVLVIDSGVPQEYLEQLHRMNLEVYIAS
jgi:DeoR/GlpR family transcriptional regulator of sugar metabolism